MAAKILKFDAEALASLKTGIDILSQAVKITLGPKGRNVVIDKKFGAPTITKDGVTVAKEIELEDEFQNMGAQMVKEVASKTSDVAGDGTTTATVLAQAIFAQGLKNVTAGSNPTALKRGIDEAVKAVIKNLQSMSREVSGKTEIAQVGSISANNDSAIGELIADAMDKVGKDGATQRLPRLIGRSLALEYLLTADMIPVTRAYEIGLVNHIVPEDELFETGKKMLLKILSKGPLAIQFILETVRYGLNNTLRDGLDKESEYFGKACASSDMKEGTSAFLDKRKPQFKGK